MTVRKSVSNEILGKIEGRIDLEKQFVEWRKEQKQNETQPGVRQDTLGVLQLRREYKKQDKAFENRCQKTYKMMYKEPKAKILGKRGKTRQKKENKMENYYSVCHHLMLSRV